MDNNDFNNGYNAGNNDFNTGSNGYIPPNNGGYNNGFNNGNGGDDGGAKTMAITGFVLSFFISIAGLIVSILALNKFKQTGATDGKGFATAGLIISIIAIAISIIGVGCYACMFCLALSTG